jgi:hypothetical protein
MSFGTSSICVLCTSQPSITSCEGCQRKFCLTCLSQHRNDLSLELDDLFNRRNELVEIISNHLPSNTTDRCSCFDEINRWQNEMHANIDRIASTARDNVRKFLSEASKNVRKELDQISQDLQQRQKTGGYVEGDLNRIKQQLIKLNDIVQRFNEQIRIDTRISKSIDWDSLLFVIPNKETPPVVPSNSNLYSSFSQSKNFNLIIIIHLFFLGSSITTSMPHQNFYSNTSTPTSVPRAIGNLRPTGRSASISMGSRPLTYTCIGCKTTNPLNENGRNICSTCRCPAPF